MAKQRNKYYVVWNGNTPGIYKSWAECQVQIKGYPNAKYKGFKTKEEAQFAYNDHYSNHFSKSSTKTKPLTNLLDSQIKWESWSVDAACSGNPGKMEYRGVHTKTKNEIFSIGPMNNGTNNIGEILALVHALALLKKEDNHNMPVYSDSRIAIGWLKKKRINTKLKRTTSNVNLFKLIERAEAWMKVNNPKNPILKWNTKEWGEIPADFGRK